MSLVTPNFFISRRFPQIRRISSNTDSGTASTFTFTNQSIGTVVPGRVIVVCCAWVDNGSNTTPSISTATIGGVSATVLVSAGFSDDSFRGYERCAILYCAVPTGTTATIVINMTPTSGTSMNIQVYNVTDLQSSTAFASATDTTWNKLGTAVSDVTLNIPLYGLLIVSAGQNSGARTFTGVTKDADVGSSSTGFNTPLPSETARAISYTADGWSSLVVASFR